MSGVGSRATINSHQASDSDFVHRSARDTLLSVGAFVLLLSLIIGVAAVSFEWDWTPRLFLAFLALSAVLLARSRLLGQPPAFHEENIHLTTATLGLLSLLVLLAAQHLS